MHDASLVAVAHCRKQVEECENRNRSMIDTPVCSSWYTRNIFISSRTTASGVNLARNKQRQATLSERTRCRKGALTAARTAGWPSSSA